MTDDERGTGEVANESAEHRGDIAYEPPRLAVIGSLEQLTQGSGIGGNDTAGFSEA
jgi:hypothetical protein